MMHALANGLPLSTDDPSVAYAVDALTGELLCYGKKAGAYFDSAAVRSDCAYALALAAALHLMTLTRPGRQRAMPYIDRARAAATGATEHERTFVAAICAWAAGDMPQAALLHMAMAHMWPQDLVALKIGHFHHINGGDFAAMRASLGPVVTVLPDAPFINGMLAFALDQCGDHRAAERAADRALSLADDPWAHHAMAHVFDGGGRMAEGRAWMLAARHSWSGCSSFLYTHNWWHTALFALGEGDIDSVTMLYDQHVWGIRPGYAQDQVNAISLLGRLELHGVDVGGRWAALAPYVRERAQDRENGFVDLHYTYALARTGHDALCATIIAEWDVRASGARLPCRARLCSVMAQATRGVIAHARGDRASAAAYLRPVQPVLQQLGGSHTQRAWFAMLLNDAERDPCPATMQKAAA